MEDEQKVKPDFSRIGKSNVDRSRNHERLVVKFLNEWTGEAFRRRRVTGRDHATTSVDLYADVIPVDKQFIFSVEAKCGAGYSQEALLGSPRTCVFTEWWFQTCYDTKLVSEQLGRRLYPMLFFRPTPQTNWVAVGASSLDRLRPADWEHVDDRCKFPHLLYGHYGNLGPVSGKISHQRNAKKSVELELDRVIMCRWKDFVAGVDPSSAFERR